ncbi:MAG: LacI family DNA-binding transcriptional regulator, partial [bacterium]
MVKLKDIADVCGVSVATVSRALNGLTNESKERTAFIRRTAQEMGYYPNVAAKTLKTSRSNNLGILYEDRMNHEYFSSLLDDIRRESNARGYDLMLIGSSEETERNYYEHVRKRNLDGVIVIQADFSSPDVIRLAGSDIPTVVIDHMYDGCDCDNKSDSCCKHRQLVVFKDIRETIFEVHFAERGPVGVALFFSVTHACSPSPERSMPAIPVPLFMVQIRCVSCLISSGDPMISIVPW